MLFLLRVKIDSSLSCVLTWVWGGICVLNQGLPAGKPGTAVVTGRETAL